MLHPKITLHLVKIKKDVKSQHIALRGRGWGGSCRNARWHKSIEVGQWLPHWCMDWKLSMYLTLSMHRIKQTCLVMWFSYTSFDPSLIAIFFSYIINSFIKSNIGLSLMVWSNRMVICVFLKLNIFFKVKWCI